VPQYPLFRWGALAVATGHWLQAAEPEISHVDLPRIPATEPAGALSTFRIKPGFELQLVAAEPLLADPVAMDFDENGRLYVVEMRDYSERRDEQLGRIRVLEDTDGDGRFDQSFVFAEGLPWPTAVVCFDGGVFVGSTPDIIFMRDNNGDRRADQRDLIFSGFAADSLKRLNVQALFNSFHWGLDNRIHGSASVSGGRITIASSPGSKPVELRGRDFSFDPRTFDLRPETGGGQHGMSFDNAGRKFLCSNSDHIQFAMFDDRYLGRNPLAELPSPRQSIAKDGPAAEVFRRSPDEPWRVIRTRWRVTGAVEGLIEGGGRPSGYFTGATGVTIYRGDAFPSDYLGDAFIADCGSNLIHHKKVQADGVSYTADRAPDEQKTEFLASTDNWFRPVQFANGPDGALYVADMYRETIEHPWSIPESIKRHLDLNSGNDRGRVYRIVPAGFKQPTALRIAQQSPQEWVGTLEHPNGWHRDTASRLIFQRKDNSLVPALLRVATSSPTPLGRIHALWALDGLRGVNEKALTLALADTSPTVREQGLRLLERWPQFLGSPEIRKALGSLATDSNPRVCYQLAWTLSVIEAADETSLLNQLSERSLSEPALVPAILNAVEANSLTILNTLLNSKPAADKPGPAIGMALCRMIGKRGVPDELQAAIRAIASLKPSTLSVSLLGALASGVARPQELLTSKTSAEVVAQHVDWAMLAARNTNSLSSPDHTGASAIRLIGYLPFSRAGETLLTVLGPKHRANERAAAVEALSAYGSADVANLLVSRWSEFAAEVRPELITLMTRRKAWVPALVAGIERGAIARLELNTAQVNALRAEKEPQLQGRILALLGAPKTVQRQTMVNRYLPALARKGDRSRGLKVYDQRCATCHRLQGRGRAVGPDFESVRSMGKEKLLTQILDPNREVAPNFQAYLMETAGGESLTGLLVAETPANIRLKTADGLETQWSRDQIKSFAPAGLSLMPEGLEEGVSEQDMADLLELLAPTP
jgi:putative membrane-bound dehydrogenase-like protein